MNRRNFLKTTLATSTLALAAPSILIGAAAPKKKKRKETPLKLSFQEPTAPGKTLTEHFDFMEANDIVGFEPYGWGLI